jgi:transcriptional regulator with XRE-family HTH domain
VIVIGQELRALRGTRTQVAYAEELGVQPNTVARYERDELQIPETVARLARCLARLTRKTPQKRRG